MKNIKAYTWYLVAASLLVGMGAGWVLFGTRHASHSNASSAEVQLEYTCAMHPQIRQSEPGNCPICGMELIPLQSDPHALDVIMSPTAMQLADVRTSVVGKRKPVKSIRLNGRVKADERKIYSQSSHLGGRIEQLLVATTGERVRKGDILAYVYSPDLVTAQKEIQEAHRYRETQPALYEAARNKLRNWKLTDDQIDRIVKTGEIKTQFPILADVSGIVLAKKVQLGDYIQQGGALFELADLSSVWILFDVYERDLQWIERGDRITFEVGSIPGFSKTGSITFIDPVIDPRTRVASARMEFRNPDFQLKPDMFVKGKLESERSDLDEEIIIPHSAVMWTGERSVVYVKQSEDHSVHFQMREVQLGPSLGDHYVILDGLQEGEEIATSGTFSIDAAAQLAGKPSMMNRSAHSTHDTLNLQALSSASPADQKVMAQWIDGYIAVKDNLVADDVRSAKAAATELIGSLTAEKTLADRIGMSSMIDLLTTLAEGTDIGASRKAFQGVSKGFISLSKALPELGKPLYILWCPMANDNKGASWLSDQRTVRNPYFGKSMLTCGSVIDSMY